MKLKFQRPKKVTWIDRLPLIRSTNMDLDYWRNRALSLQDEVPLATSNSVCIAVDSAPSKVSYSNLIRSIRTQLLREMWKEISCSLEACDASLENASTLMKELQAREDSRKDRIKQKASSYITQSVIITTASTLFFAVFGDKIDTTRAPQIWIFTTAALFVLMVSSFTIAVINAINAHKAVGIARIQPSILITALNSGSINAKKQMLEFEFMAYFENAYPIKNKAKSQIRAAHFFSIGLSLMLILSATTVALMLSHPKSTQISPPAQPAQNITNKFSIF